MTRPRMLAALAAVLAVTAAGAGAGAQARGPAAQAPSPADRPTKVVIIVVDSLSKEIVEKYDMRNVEALMRDGVDTPRGYLGHTGSVTVVTHNVITSGQLPKHMGWTDEGYRDVDGILGDPEPANPDQLYITSNATTDLFKLQQAAGYPKLADYLGAADPAAKTFTSAPRDMPATPSAAPTRRLDHHLRQRTRVHDRTHLAQAHRHQCPGVHQRIAVQPVLGAQRLSDLRLRHRQAAGDPLPARQRPLHDRQGPGPPGR